MSSAIQFSGDAFSRVHRFTLGGFLLVSLLIHALILALWRAEAPSGPVGQSTFRVTLLARHGEGLNQSVAGFDSSSATARRPLDRATAKSASDRAQPAGTRQLTPPKLSENVVDGLKTPRRIAGGKERKQRKDSPAGPPVAARPTAADSRKAEIRNNLQQLSSAGLAGSKHTGEQQLTSAAMHRKVRAELLKALLPYFEYPAIARRRGWEGRVMVGVLVEADGELSDVHLVESSGYSQLDKSAVKNVLELSSLPGARQWLDGREIDVILPVSYRLYQ